MARKEYSKLKTEETDFKPQAGGGQGIQAKLSGLYGKLFGVIQFILGVCLLPFVYSSSVAFTGQFGAIDTTLQNCLWSGVIAFLIIYLFIWEPLPVYTKGHRILELIFNFFKPLVKVAPFLLPVYTIVLFVLYGILSAFIKDERLIQAAMFLFGFSIILHLVFSSKSIRTKKGDFLKGNYIFGFSFIYILNLSILAFGLNLIFKAFSFVYFSNATYSTAKDIFYAVFKQLFLR
ncbi:MAG: hypothetical protein ABSE81_06185 [Candidatus Omnitrophota bacterium]|jgi:hypothetical protein